jgi:hypothetical protein
VYDAVRHQLARDELRRFAGAAGEVAGDRADELSGGGYGVGDRGQLGTRDTEHAHPFAVLGSGYVSFFCAVHLL